MYVIVFFLVMYFHGPSSFLCFFFFLLIFPVIKSHLLRSLTANAQCFEVFLRGRGNGVLEEFGTRIDAVVVFCLAQTATAWTARKYGLA